MGDETPEWFEIVLVRDVDQLVEMSAEDDEANPPYLAAQELSAGDRFAWAEGFAEGAMGE